ncbi:MAG TPA: hypothetical protein VKU19_18765 [Bryobacteraceae bacterium]|nr:hypothetical protein [Bryobacteraceae bacterium]
MKLLLGVLVLGACALHCMAQTKALRIVFRPDSDQFADAAREYQTIWASEGDRITAAMEAASGLKFEDREVEAIVREVSSSSGYKEKPMLLRASYPLDTKKATLIHELGHRLEADLFHQGEDDHKYLFLWIYDVWVKLYGREFADAQVAVERERGRMYPAAWDFALSFSPEQRSAKWKETVAERMQR